MEILIGVLRKKTVICKACAAETIYDALQVADSCPYCGSNQVMEASADNTLAPNGVCTFEVTDKQAGFIFKNGLKEDGLHQKLRKLVQSQIPLKVFIYRIGRSIQKLVHAIRLAMVNIEP